MVVLTAFSVIIKG